MLTPNLSVAGVPPTVDCVVLKVSLAVLLVSTRELAASAFCFACALLRFVSVKPLWLLCQKDFCGAEVGRKCEETFMSSSRWILDQLIAPLLLLRFMLPELWILSVVESVEASGPEPTRREPKVILVPARPLRRDLVLDLTLPMLEFVALISRSTPSRVSV
jgi:hypothetical protein